MHLGSQGSSMLNILRSHQPVFQSGCIILQFHQQHGMTRSSPHPCPTLVTVSFFFFFFFDYSPPGGVKVNSLLYFPF